MKKLGLIGGVGPESTVPYYKGIVYGVQKRVGKPYFPNLTIESLSTFEVIRMSSAGDTAGLTEYMLNGFKNLAAAGAEIGAMACNTGHMVFDALQKESPIPLISIVETARREAEKQGYRKLGLIGTLATMEDDFFKAPFRKAGIDIVVPPASERTFIADKISSELELGVVKEDTANAVLDITKRLDQDQQIDAIVLGCTELPMIFTGRQTVKPVLDTMQLHIQALVDAIMEE